MTKEKYLKAVEEAYKQASRATTIIGLYLTEPFPASDKGAKLAGEARQLSLDLEQKLRDLYTAENAAERP